MSGSANGFAATAHRDFAPYWLGSLLGNLGFQMQSAALFWQVYDLTGSTLDLAFIDFAEFAPSLLLLAVTARPPIAWSAAPARRFRAGGAGAGLAVLRRRLSLRHRAGLRLDRRL
jgi:hypothetical protein